MYSNNIKLSVSYVEFINNVDKLMFNVLYSPNEGYTLLHSKEAVFEFDNCIKKFTQEAQNIKKDSKIDNAQDIIDLKTKKLIKQMKTHYDKEFLIWIDDTYKDALENILTFAFSQKKNRHELINVYNEAMYLISWYKNVKNLGNDAKKALIDELNSKFQRVLKAKNEEYYKEKAKIKTDEKYFIKLYNLILSNEKEFINIDEENFKTKLNDNDIQFFKTIKNNLQNYKRTSQKDEIYLINSAITCLNLVEDEDKYSFIKDIVNDFTLFLAQNKTLKEEDKIKIVKKRLQIFGSKNNRKSALDYYIKQIT